MMVKGHWLVGHSRGNSKGQFNCRNVSNIGSVWSSSFPITKMTLFPLIRLMLPKVWSQFPSNAVRDGIIQGSWYTGFSSVEPKRDGRAGTLTSHICYCDRVCHDLLKIFRISTYKDDEFPALFTAELGWNPVWVISVFALAVRNAFHFTGIQFYDFEQRVIGCVNQLSRIVFSLYPPWR